MTVVLENRDQLKLDCNTQDKTMKRTPLHYAAENNDFHLLTMLARIGGDVDGTRDNDGKTARDSITDSFIRDWMETDTVSTNNVGVFAEYSAVLKTVTRKELQSLFVKFGMTAVSVSSSDKNVDVEIMDQGYEFEFEKLVLASGKSRKMVRAAMNYTRNNCQVSLECILMDWYQMELAINDEYGEINRRLDLSVAELVDKNGNYFKQFEVDNKNLRHIDKEKFIIKYCGFEHRYFSRISDIDDENKGGANCIPRMTFYIQIEYNPFVYINDYWTYCGRNLKLVDFGTQVVNIGEKDSNVEGEGKQKEKEEDDANVMVYNYISRALDVGYARGSCFGYNKCQQGKHYWKIESNNVKNLMAYTFAIGFVSTNECKLNDKEANEWYVAHKNAVGLYSDRQVWSNGDLIKNVKFLKMNRNCILLLCLNFDDQIIEGKLLKITRTKQVVVDQTSLIQFNQVGLDVNQEYRLACYLRGVGQSIKIIDYQKEPFDEWT